MTDQENLLNQTFANIEVKQCGDYNDDDDEDRDDKIDQTFFSDLAASQNHKPLFATALSSSITSPPLYSTVSPEVPGLATSPSSSSSRRNSKRFSTQSFNFLMGVAGSSELNNVVGEVGTVITASSTSDVDEAWVYNHQQSSNGKQYFRTLGIPSSPS